MRKVLQGPFLGETLFGVITSSLGTRSRSMLIIVAAYTKLRAIICTKADQNIRWKQLWDVKGSSNTNGTDARVCPDGLLIISDAIWELIS